MDMLTFIAFVTAIVVASLCLALCCRQRIANDLSRPVQPDESAPGLDPQDFADPTGQFPLPPPLDPCMCPANFHAASDSFPSVTKHVALAFVGQD
jgi:hypothetical protein